METPIKPIPTREFLELVKNVNKLSSQEMERMTFLQREYEEKLSIYKNNLDEWLKIGREKERKQIEEAYNEFYLKHNLSKDDIEHPLFRRLDSIAYDLGHSCGVNEVLSYLDNMIDIYFDYGKNKNV